MQNSDIEKCILMAASEDNFILEIILNGCFSKTAAKYNYFKNSRLHIFYISLLWRHVKEEWSFMELFLSKGFDEKCKQTKLALNFIQNSILGKKHVFPLI